jgi:hypothetical protein
MLADEQGYEEQRQDAEQAKAAKVTKLGDAGMGELGHVSSGTADRVDSMGWGFLDCNEGDLNRPPNQSHIDSSH